MRACHKAGVQNRLPHARRADGDILSAQIFASGNIQPPPLELIPVTSEPAEQPAKNKNDRDDNCESDKAIFKHCAASSLTLKSWLTF
jgi:hypothetical protein